MVGRWRGYASGSKCRSLSLAPVNPDWFYLPGFTFLVPTHPGSPGQSRGLCVRSCMCARVCVCVNLKAVKWSLVILKTPEL